MRLMGDQGGIILFKCIIFIGTTNTYHSFTNVVVVNAESSTLVHVQCMHMHIMLAPRLLSCRSMHSDDAK